MGRVATMKDSPRLQEMVEEAAALLAGAKPEAEHYERFVASIVRRYGPRVLADQQDVDAFFDRVTQRVEELRMRKSLGLR